MADYRSIQTKIWGDPWFEEQSPHGKLLFMFLFTNYRANCIGVYELSLKSMSEATGIERDEIKGLLNSLEIDEKIMWRDGWVWIVNMRKHQDTGSPNFKKGIEYETSRLPDNEVTRKYNQHYYQQIP